MEWIIGFAVLWFIGKMSESGKSTSRDSEAQKKKKDDLDEILRSIRTKEVSKSTEPVADAKPANTSATPSLKSTLSEAEKRRKYGQPETNKPSAQAQKDLVLLQAIDFLRSKNVNSLWHMTHVNNLDSILHSGILNHGQARQSHQVTDISDAGVQENRMAKEPVYGRAIHDYAPLYINPRNPMLYRLKDIAFDLCLLEVSLDVLTGHSSKGLLFSSGNAAARNTRFYRDLAELPQLPWDVLCADFWSDFDDGKRKACAEFLIYPNIDPAMIIGIHTKAKFRLLGQKPLPTVTHGHLIKTTPKLFF